MPYKCHLEIDGKRCSQLFESRRKLKEHLSPSPHSVLKVVCPLCFTREVTFNRAADLKAHVMRRHREAILNVNVPFGELLSENNAFWISFYPAHYRALVDPTDRETRAATRLRALLLEWARKCNAHMARSRKDWLEGWELPATKFQHVSASDVQEYCPEAPGIFTVVAVSIVQGAITATLEDSSYYYRVDLSDQALFDPRSIASLSRKMATLSPVELPNSFTETEQDTNHLASSLGVEVKLIQRVSRAAKGQTSQTPEIELFAESDIDDVCEGTPQYHPTISSCTSLEPPRKRQRSSGSDNLLENPRLAVHPNNTSVVTSISLPSINPSGSIPTIADSETTKPLNTTTTQQARHLLAYGCMPLLPPARRNWEKEEAVCLRSGQISILWPPKGFKAFTRDQKLLEVEFTALTLKRSTPGGFGPVDRATLLDEFNFLVLPGTVCLSPRKTKVASVKSRVYLYYTIRDLANGNNSSRQDIAIMEFLQHGSSKRDRSWDHLIEAIESAGIPLRLRLRVKLKQNIAFLDFNTH